MPGIVVGDRNAVASKTVTELTFRRRRWAVSTGTNKEFQIVIRHLKKIKLCIRVESDVSWWRARVGRKGHLGAERQ